MRTTGNPIQIIQGGQWGSEAKGAVAAHLAVTENVDFAVRTGAVNAGHTFYHPKDKQKFVMQQLPVGWANPGTQIVIGAGALVDPEVLRREIVDIGERTGEDIRRRLFVDPRAYLHWPRDAKESAKAGRHVLIGATGKGCSEALISRLRLRGVEDFTIGKHADKLGIDVRMVDTEKMLNDAWDEGAKIQLEGTQGQLLDLCLGPYPYTTHKQTSPGQWMTEAGLSPSLPVDVVLVVRTCPIRVAGNSGPMPEETSWPTLARSIAQERRNYGLPPIVHEQALREFELAVQSAARSFSLPPGSDGLDQHRWSAEDRLTYREALSQLHATVMSELHPSTVEELRKLFEVTTVTKKLRRIAYMDIETLARSARQARPSRVVVTFLNYVFPDEWFTTAELRPEEREYLDTIANVCDAPVTLASRGPLPEHFIAV